MEKVRFVLNGVDYGECQLVASRYFTKHNNIALYVKNDNGLVAVCSTNLDMPELNNDKFVAIKNYSENVGMDKWLIDNGYINKFPICGKQSGFVYIPVYGLTEKGKALLK